MDAVLAALNTVNPEDSYTEFIDRGDCESTTPPMVSGETVPILTGATFARSSDFRRGGTYSYKCTNTTTASISRIHLVDNETITDMHGFVAGETYTFSAWVYIPTASGILPSEVALRMGSCVSIDFIAIAMDYATKLDTWEEISITGTFDSAATGAQITIWITSGASPNEYFYVDDISVSQPIYDTTIAWVSETLTQHDQIPEKNLPAAMPIDADEVRGWESLAGTSTKDMRGEMSIIVSCVVYDRENATRAKRLAMMKDVEKCLMNDATLGALILDIEPQRVVTDKGTIPNYSVWDHEFLIRYFYNSENGG